MNILDLIKDILYKLIEDPEVIKNLLRLISQINSNNIELDTSNSIFAILSLIQALLSFHESLTIEPHATDTLSHWHNAYLQGLRHMVQEHPELYNPFRTLPLNPVMETFIENVEGHLGNPALRHFWDFPLHRPILEAADLLRQYTITRLPLLELLDGGIRPGFGSLQHILQNGLNEIYGPLEYDFAPHGVRNLFYRYLDLGFTFEQLHNILRYFPYEGPAQTPQTLALSITRSFYSIFVWSINQTNLLNENIANTLGPGAQNMFIGLQNFVYDQLFTYVAEINQNASPLELSRLINTLFSTIGLNTDSFNFLLLMQPNRYNVNLFMPFLQNMDILRFINPIEFIRLVPDYFDT